MNKRIINQKGLSLVELLTVIVLTAIFSTLLFSITTKALENTRVISQETVLRDEADIIVSKFIKAMYSTRQDHIIWKKTDVNGDSYLEITSDLTKCRKNEAGQLLNVTQCNATLKTIGFKTINGVTKIHILGEEYEIINKGIKVLPTSKVNGKPEDTSVYEIELKLKITHTRGNKEMTKEMTFKNEIQPIVSSK